MKKTVLFLAASLFSTIALAAVRLPNIFGDNMVLQRDKPIPIWGWANKNEKVTVQFNGQVKTVKAGKDGQWKVLLNAEKAGGPYDLLVKSSNSITLHNILMGDVWICSGQSNMEFGLPRASNAAEAVPAEPVLAPPPAGVPAGAGQAAAAAQPCG